MAGLGGLRYVRAHPAETLVLALLLIAGVGAGATAVMVTATCGWELTLVP